MKCWCNCNNSIFLGSHNNFMITANKAWSWNSQESKACYVEHKNILWSQENVVNALCSYPLWSTEEDNRVSWFQYVDRPMSRSIVDPSLTVVMLNPDQGPTNEWFFEDLTDLQTKLFLGASKKSGVPRTTRHSQWESTSLPPSWWSQRHRKDKNPTETSKDSLFFFLHSSC